MDALGLKSGNWLILPRQGLWREQGPAHGSAQPECRLQRSQCRSRWAGTIHSPAPCFCSKNAHLWSCARRESRNTCRALLWEQSVCVSVLKVSTQQPRNKSRAAPQPLAVAWGNHELSTSQQWHFCSWQHSKLQAWMPNSQQGGEMWLHHCH